MKVSDIKPVAILEALHDSSCLQRIIVEHLLEHFARAWEQSNGAPPGPKDRRAIRRQLEEFLPDTLEWSGTLYAVWIESLRKRLCALDEERREVVH